MTTPLRFVSLGHGHVACANNIWAVVRTDTAQNRRLLRKAKEQGLYLDWTARRPMKALVLLDNGQVIGSCFSVTTIFHRLSEACGYGHPDAIYTEEDSENEN